MTKIIPAMTITTHEMAPCGARGPVFLPRAGLNLAIRCDGSTAHARIDLMTRRLWLPLTLLLAACSKPEPMPDLFAETMGQWRRTSERDVSPSQAPDPLPQTAIRQIRIATYEGPGKLEARLYRVTSSAVALDLVQRWRPSADTIFFYLRDYVAVVKWQEADRRALQEFVRELETRLDPQAGKRAP